MTALLGGLAAQDAPITDVSLVRALLGRLRDAASPLGLRPDQLATARTTALLRGPAAAAAELLDAATASAHASGRLDRLWLLLAATHGQLPLPQDVLRLRRRFELDEVAASSRFLLDTTSSVSVRFSPYPVQVVYGTTTVVDTGHTSGWPVTTGIQRVVREVVRRWLPTHPLRLVGWTEDLTAMRGLDRQETHLIARWGELASEQGSGEGTELVIPWHTTYLLPEVPPGEERMARLAALAQYSGSRVLLIGYDLIPTTNVELVPAGLAENFSDYLTLVKHSRRVVAISETAAREFRGFMHAIQSQGLPGPEIVTCLLPAAPPPPGLPHQFESLPLDDDVPVVLMVGSIEARKNHLAVLQAAELLWREGIRFRLLILGNTNINSSEVVGRIHELDQEGRDVHLRSGVSDAALGDAYQQSRVLVFVSTHEGYGLPVAEALAAGTPVITTSFGSTAEAAEGGGALLVDPYDDEAITDALRKVLLDDSLQADLTARARARPSRGWDDYARELWSFTEEGGAA